MRGRACRFAAFGAVSAGAVLAACAAGTTTPKIALRDDTFLPYREYTAGQQTTRSYPNRTVTELVARVDRKTQARTTLLGVGLVYKAHHMRKYESARNARAGPLPLHKVSRHRACEERSCIFDEQFTILIPEDELRRAPPAGYQLKVFAREGGDATITVAKADIDRLLAALDKP